MADLCAMIEVEGGERSKMKKGEFDLRRLEGERSGGGYSTLDRKPVGMGIRCASWT
jgi:hypothetical protein